jgi:hypothetical protein
MLKVGRLAAVLGPAMAPRRAPIRPVHRPATPGTMNSCAVDDPTPEIVHRTIETPQAARGDSFALRIAGIAVQARARCGGPCDP